MESRICTNCNKEFRKYAKPAKNYFCSKECYHKWAKGKDNPNWKGGDIKFVCEECGKEFGVRRDRMSKQDGKFCSKKCHHRSIGKNKMSITQRHIAKHAIKTLLYWLRYNAEIKINWVERFGYEPIKFKEHIESLFKPGMSWENYGEWELDHIRPTLLFRFESVNDQEFKKCFALENLQPLWKRENLLKGKKYDI